MDYNLLKNSVIFRDIPENEIPALLKCLDYREKSCENGETIFRAGERLSRIGLVLSGSVNIESYDFLGVKNIFAHLSEGETFGEAYALAGSEILTVNAVAADKCTILLLDAEKIFSTCGHTCPYHSRLVQNLLLETARKNLRLTEKITYTSPKTIRARLISYLSAQSAKQGGYSFEIPFSRQQLADYLSVDRSALSAELGKMRNEGIIDFHKNSFRLKNG